MLTMGKYSIHAFGNMQHTVIGIQCIVTKEFLIANIAINSNWKSYLQHDITIQALLQNLEVFQNNVPPYCAAVIIELHEHQKGEFFVEIYYKNDSSKDETYLFPVLFSKCKTPCPLDEFAKLASEHVPTDWEAECRVEIPLEIVYKKISIGLGIATFAFAILFAISFYTNCHSRNGKHLLENYVKCKIFLNLELTKYTKKR